MPHHKEFHLTQEGAENLRTELLALKGPRRTELAKRLRQAIQQGDLAENADYHKAKEDQAFLEGRIQELEMILRNAVIIQNSKNGVIELGSKVTVKEKGKQPFQYFLVGAKEADPRNGKISNESPIGRALLGHKVGETVRFETPVGKIEIMIISVE